MDIQVLHDKTVIYDFLKQERELQIYCIGDLDDFYWPHTIWFALRDKKIIKSLALLYVGMDTPTLLLFHKGSSAFSKHLLEGIRDFLPQELNVHLSTGLLEVFERRDVLTYYGFSHKMILKKNVAKPDDQHIRRLTIDDVPSLVELLAISYPQNWFDSRMIQTGKYFGYFNDGQLIGVAGIHVYSEEYKVAALGNITVHPGYRRQGMASKLTLALCYDLQKSTDVIGLNVRAENESAIKCYSNIGFEIIGSYNECYVKNEQNKEMPTDS